MKIQIKLIQFIDMFRLIQQYDGFEVGIKDTHLRLPFGISIPATSAPCKIVNLENCEQIQPQSYHQSEMFNFLYDSLFSSFLQAEEHCPVLNTND